MLGTAYATNISGYTILGDDGWRFAFRTVAVVAALIGFATLRVAKDPSRIEGFCGHLIDEKKGLRDTLMEFKQACPKQESTGSSQPPMETVCMLVQQRNLLQIIFMASPVDDTDWEGS
jgi:hypothetical protein